MRRREFVAIIGAAAAWPTFARAQNQERIARIGYLGLSASVNPAFLQGLAELGYVDGRNLKIEFRSAEGDEARLPALAAELVELDVDVIVTHAAGVFAAQRATRTVPIVMATAPDVVAMGVVASLARPGGNVTGLTFFFPELMAKRLELLEQATPAMRRTGVLLAEGNPANHYILQAMGVVAEASKLELRLIPVRDPAELESAIAVAADDHIAGLEIADHPMLLSSAAETAIAAIAARRGLASIGSLGLARNGGLLSYGVSFAEIYRRAAFFVDRILKGSKPGDLPIEQATRFRTIVNLKTAKALGVEIPQTLLAAADEVIE
jgi:putative ABC transport system substrate-binding protein